MHRTVTLYRYHDGTAAGTGDERLLVNGVDHQLKMVFSPEQVEFFAQKFAEVQIGSPDDALDSAAVRLLQSDDDDTDLMNGDDGSPELTWDITLNVASKVIGYANTATDDRVTAQYVQSDGCGCSGGTTRAQKLSYETEIWTASSSLAGWFTGDGFSQQITHHEWDTGSRSATRTRPAPMA